MKRLLTILFSLVVLFSPFSNAFSGQAGSPEETLIRRKCTSCHTLPKKGKLPEDKLRAKLGEHKNRVQLSPEDEEGVIKFLKASE